MPTVLTRKWRQEPCPAACAVGACPPQEPTGPASASPGPSGYSRPGWEAVGPGSAWDETWGPGQVQPSGPWEEGVGRAAHWTRQGDHDPAGHVKGSEWSREHRSGCLGSWLQSLPRWSSAREDVPLAPGPPSLRNNDGGGHDHWAVRSLCSLHGLFVQTTNIY